MRIRNVVFAAALAATPALFAQPAEAGVVGCTLANVTIDAIRPRALVNCTFDSVGNCVFFYDPLFDPFPENVVPETLELVFCTAL